MTLTSLCLTFVVFFLTTLPSSLKSLLKPRRAAGLPTPGSKLDRTLSAFSIVTTATPEYVSGVLLIAVFASSMVGLKWFKGSASSAMEGVDKTWGSSSSLRPVLR